MLSTENLAKLSDLRGRVLRNEHVSDEELQEALKLLAENRMVAAENAAKKKTSTRSSIAVPDSATLLAKLAVKTKKE